MHIRIVLKWGTSICSVHGHAFQSFSNVAVLAGNNLYVRVIWEFRTTVKAILTYGKKQCHTSKIRTTLMLNPPMWRIPMNSKAWIGDKKIWHDISAVVNFSSNTSWVQNAQSSTMGFHCNMVQYNITVCIILQWRAWNLEWTMNSQKYSHTSSMKANCGVSVVIIWNENWL